MSEKKLEKKEIKLKRLWTWRIASQLDVFSPRFVSFQDRASLFRISVYEADYDVVPDVQRAIGGFSLSNRQNS